MNPEDVMYVTFVPCRGVDGRPVIEVMRLPPEDAARKAKFGRHLAQLPLGALHEFHHPETSTGAPQLETLTVAVYAAINGPAERYILPPGVTVEKGTVLRALPPGSMKYSDWLHRN